MWIVRLALNRPYAFVVVALLILIASPVVVLRTPTDIFPNIDIPVIAAAWLFTGLNPEEMEGRITTQYERVLTTTVRDRDQVYGERFSHQARMLDIHEAVIAPRSPWQNAYAERVIGSIRRECLDHVVVIGERHLREILSKYVDYYNGTRTHLSLSKDAPKPRSVQLPSQGRVVKVPRVGGLHHEYRRRAA
jgi:integrase-like protein/AcrB/AcrD/AcrF family protein